MDKVSLEARGGGSWHLTLVGPERIALDPGRRSLLITVVAQAARYLESLRGRALAVQWLWSTRDTAGPRRAAPSSLLGSRFVNRVTQFHAVRHSEGHCHQAPIPWRDHDHRMAQRAP
jgi:hypothetical protein